MRSKLRQSRCAIQSSTKQGHAATHRRASSSNTSSTLLARLIRFLPDIKCCKDAVRRRRRRARRQRADRRILRSSQNVCSFTAHVSVLPGDQHLARPRGLSAASILSPHERGRRLAPRGSCMAAWNAPPLSQRPASSQATGSHCTSLSRFCCRVMPSEQAKARAAAKKNRGKTGSKAAPAAGMCTSRLHAAAVNDTNAAASKKEEIEDDDEDIVDPIDESVSVPPMDADEPAPAKASGSSTPAQVRSTCPLSSIDCHVREPQPPARRRRRLPMHSTRATAPAPLPRTRPAVTCRSSASPSRTTAYRC